MCGLLLLYLRYHTYVAWHLFLAVCACEHTYSYQRINKAEVSRGAELGRPRLKLETVGDMLQVSNDGRKK